MSDGNRITLKSYAEKFREYDANSSQDVTGPSKDWIDKVLAQFPKDAKIFEIGTAHARDARYIAGKGYSLMCSDAIDEFEDDIHRKGFEAVKFNVLNDEFSKYYDIIIANAVMPHFDDSEFDIVLKKTIDALKPGGVFAFTIKAGEGSEWHSEKIDAPRFFRYWTKHELNDKLRALGFHSFELTEAQTDRAHAEWIYLIVKKPSQ